MRLFSRSDMLAAKLPQRDVRVPEMGPDAVVRVQQMSVNTRANYFERIRQNQNDQYAFEDDQALPEAERKGIQKPAELDKGVLSIIYSVVDENGDFLFSEDDMPLFNTWSSNAVVRLYEVVIDLNEYDRTQSEQIEAEKKD